MLKEWLELPEIMRNDEVKKYYDILYRKKISLFIKRIFDILASVCLLVVLSPVLLFISIWITFDSKGPVFYRQERVTQYGRVFRIFKFRTMIVDADKLGSSVTVENDQRITKVGMKIRRLRLDELPQLINVLNGDMSFVGARPEVKKYVDGYSNEMLATLLLPAGITSIASINFKNEDELISSLLDGKETVDHIYIKEILPKKMAFNLEYIRDFKFTNDLKICLNTLLIGR
ncbi:sugar transferase [[Clostridium] innocuum]|nr:sugar transferase [[Clostridium] innocuum]MCR0575976.1 sugar transferase [[Clostridium] innocuum]